jgi:hypothetical protein
MTRDQRPTEGDSVRNLLLTERTPFLAGCRWLLVALLVAGALMLLTIRCMMRACMCRACRAAGVALAVAGISCATLRLAG